MSGRAVQATKPLNCATSRNAVASKDDKKDSKDPPKKDPAKKDADSKKEPAKKDLAKPGFDPKPVQLGGESLLERLLPYMKQIVYVLVGVAVIISIIFTIRHFKERGREKQTNKLVKVIEIADREVVSPDVPPDPKKKDPTFASQKERAEAILAALNKEGATASSSFKGSLLVTAGKLDEAIAEYRKAETAKGLEGILAREGLGIALESKALSSQDAAARLKGLEEALAVFQKMQPDEKGPRAAYAFYHQGRVLAQLERHADARTALEKAKELGAGTELPNLIEERLAMLGGS
jgi:tetratricopeptide (TPR) repeat protein